MNPLRLRGPADVPLAALMEQLLGLFERLSVSLGPWKGNPLDGYYRDWEFKASGAGCELFLHMLEESWVQVSRASPSSALLGLELRGPGAAERQVSLERALATLGYVVEPPRNPR